MKIHSEIYFLHFNTGLLSRHVSVLHAFVKNGMQCSKLQSMSHRILILEHIAFSLVTLASAMKERDYIGVVYP